LCENDRQTRINAPSPLALRKNAKTMALGLVSMTALGWRERKGYYLSATLPVVFDQGQLFSRVGLADTGVDLGSVHVISLSDKRSADPVRKRTSPYSSLSWSLQHRRC
jgi:hypothetical protein